MDEIREEINKNTKDISNIEALKLILELTKQLKD